MGSSVWATHTYPEGGERIVPIKKISCPPLKDSQFFTLSLLISHFSIGPLNVNVRGLHTRTEPFYTRHYASTRRIVTRLHNRRLKSIDCLRTCMEIFFSTRDWLRLSFISATLKRLARILTNYNPSRKAIRISASLKASLF